MNDPCFDIAHLGHVEIFSNKFEESIHFFSKVYGDGPVCVVNPIIWI